MEQDICQPVASTSYLPPAPPPSPVRVSRRVRRRREDEREGRTSEGPMSVRSSSRNSHTNGTVHRAEPPCPSPSPSYDAPYPTPLLVASSARRCRRSAPSSGSRRPTLLSMVALVALVPARTLAFPYLSPRQPTPQSIALPSPLPTPLPFSVPSRKGKERAAREEGPGLHRRADEIVNGRILPDRYTPLPDGTWEVDQGWELFGVAPTVQALAQDEEPSSSTGTYTPAATSTASPAQQTTAGAAKPTTLPRGWDGSTRDSFELPVIIACTVSLAVIVILTITTFIARRNKHSRRARRLKRKATAASRASTVTVDIDDLDAEKARAQEDADSLRNGQGRWKGGGKLVVGALKSARGKKFLRRRKGGKRGGTGTAVDSVEEERDSLDESRTSAEGRISAEGAGSTEEAQRTSSGTDGPSADEPAAARTSSDPSIQPSPGETPLLPSDTNTMPSPAQSSQSASLPRPPSSDSLLSISAPAPSSPPPPHSHNPTPPAYRASTSANPTPSTSTAAVPSLDLASSSTSADYSSDEKRPFPPPSSALSAPLPPLVENQPSSSSASQSANVAHLATDDKAALASLAAQASAPYDPSSSIDVEGSAPAWAAEDDETIPEELRLGPVAGGSALPAPPGQWGGKTMEDPYLPDLDLGEPEEDTLAAVVPSAPSAPPGDNDEEEASAPPMMEVDLDDDEEGEGASAPPMEEEEEVESRT